MQADDGDGGAITGINVTPLVDVTLVILIIMMVTAPMIARRALKLDLPRSSTRSRAATDALNVALDGARRLTLSGKPIGREQLKMALAAAVAARPDQPVTVSADRNLPYGEVTALLDDIRAAGVRKVGLEVVRR
ncbi:MAG: biopolymer transporter ExbD [Elusimicrobia bacterium]|nr:biopolymer transporter ExbD [Elusimicrobiota bacterium]